jgi:hypothetical protein
MQGTGEATMGHGVRDFSSHAAGMMATMWKPPYPEDLAVDQNADGVLDLKEYEVLKNYHNLKRQLEQKVARETAPPHPFCLQDMEFFKETRTKLFQGGATQECWKLKLLCRGAFILSYDRTEGQVNVVRDMVEGTYCLAVPNDTDIDGYVPRPTTQVGTLNATVGLNAKLRLTFTKSPVHWEEADWGECKLMDQVLQVAAFPPADPEWITLRGFVTTDPDGTLPELAQDANGTELVLQRNRLGGAGVSEPLNRFGEPRLNPRGSIPLRLNRSLMPTDVDTRAPVRFFHTGPISTTVRKSFSTGALRACGPAPGYGFSKVDMARKGNQALLMRTDTMSMKTALAYKPLAHPPHNAALRRYGK